MRFAYPGDSALTVTFLTNGLVIARTAAPSRDVRISRERSPWMSFLLSRKDIEMSLRKIKTRMRKEGTEVSLHVHQDVYGSQIGHNFQLAMRQSLDKSLT